MMKRMAVSASVLVIVLVVLQTFRITDANSERVLLEDVKVITLHHGQNTNARRASSVPQLKCVGGSAGCTAFRPQTVQCYNRGSDGYDVQWECKTDMDNSYRFGKLEVSCEGYNYPDDPYILRGSCGLEYTLDLTEEGWEKKNAGGNYGNNHDYYGNQHSGYHHDDSYHHRTQNSFHHKTSSVFYDLFKLCVIAMVIYSVYKCCIATPAQTTPGTDAPPPSYDETFRQTGNQPPPPPYGFRQDYTQNTGTGGCSSNYSSTNTGMNTNNGGGFWSGAFTGGIMGYLLGNRGNNAYTYQRPHTGWWGGRNHWGTGWGGNSWGRGWGNNWGTGWGNNWGSGSSWSSARTTTRSSGFSSAPRSSGTRTASGFGGTTRR